MVVALLIIIVVVVIVISVVVYCRRTGVFNPVGVHTRTTCLCICSSLKLYSLQCSPQNKQEDGPVLFIDAKLTESTIPVLEDFESSPL